MSTLIEELNTQNRWIADGAQTIWNFNFAGGYVSTSHIKAYKESPAGGRTDLVINPSTDLIGPSQLQVTPAVPAGYTFVIYRDTPKEGPMVDFNDGSALTETSLDVTAKQAVFAAAEVADVLGQKADASDLDALDTRVDNLTLGIVDAAALTFMPAGADAVPSTVQAKLRQTPSVEDKGAVGDGVTDCTVAFLAAAAEGRWCAVGEGTFLVSDIVMESGCHFFGKGWNNTIIKLKDAANGHVFRATGKISVGLHYLKVDGNKANQIAGAVARGFYTLDCHDIVLNHVWIDGCADHGLHVSTGAATDPLTDSLCTYMHGCKFTNCGTDAMTGNGGSGMAWTGTYLWASDSYAEGNLLGGFKFTGAHVQARGLIAKGNFSGGFTTGFDSVTYEGSQHVYEACKAIDNGLDVASGLYGDGWRHQGQVDKIIHRDCTATGNGQSGICLLGSLSVRPTEVDIIGGYLTNNGQRFVAAANVAGSGVSLLSSTSSNVPASVRLRDVTITDTQGVKTQDYAIEVQQGSEVNILDGCRLAGNKIASMFNVPTLNTDIRLAPGIINADFISRVMTASSVTGTLAETDLRTITVPANTFNPGQRFRLRARGTVAGTNGTKLIRIYVGNANTLVSNQTAGDTQEWFVDAILEVVGASSIKASATGNEVGGSQVVVMLSSTTALTSALTFKITGTLGNTADTITCSSFHFEPIY